MPQVTLRAIKALKLVSQKHAKFPNFHVVASHYAGDRSEVERNCELTLLHHRPRPISLSPVENGYSVFNHRPKPVNFRNKAACMLVSSWLDWGHNESERH